MTDRKPSSSDQLGLFESPPPPAPRADGRFIEGPLPDEAARERIRSDLDANLLVEAGAGSGKTTALVERMVALVRTGTATAPEVAAVTFTRKAAAELRQRYQAGIEEAGRVAREQGHRDATDRLDRALREIDRSFIGTIHAFCARLLRERPVEAGLDPAFREMMGPEEVRLRRAFWRGHLERIAATADPLVTELAHVGLTPARLQGLFDELVANPDVTFPAEPVEPPEADAVERVRRRLGSLLDRARALMPPEPAERGWDELQTRVRLLLFLRDVVDWEDDTAFLDLIGEELHGRSCKAVQNRWPDRAAAKALAEDWLDLRDGPAAAALDRWWAHRYPIAMRFASRAAGEYAAERRRTGRLDFQDLLVLAARLLREHPGTRAELGERYRRLLVDEFQDTDPVQAEVLLLLASPPDGRPWQEAMPRPGALFVVGDPKQSIYRFRRADIAVYNLVRDRFRAFGAVVELVANFRSLPPIGVLVQKVFQGDGRFPPEATAHQAAFAPLMTRRTPVPGRPGVASYAVDPEETSLAAVAADGAARIAPWIAGEIAAGRRRPEDFLILARKKAGLATYARELEAWRVPVQVTGAGVDRAEELDELLTLLDALADPTDPVRVVAVLVGLLFGFDHDQLLAWALAEDRPEAEREAALRRFDIAGASRPDGTPVGDALHTLHGWWTRSRALPADVLVQQIVDEVGLLPLAAARDLGELRAGSVLFALDAIRVAALEGDTSIAAATDALRAALDADEAEAPLEPVRRGVARVMTLHQAKGLEADVVVLVHPTGEREYPATRHIQRRDDGTAVGHLVVQEQERFRTRTIARPAGWEEMEAEERRFDAAEQDRLLYVAATRPGELLVVSRWPEQEKRSPWAGLYPWIDRAGEILGLPRLAPPEPDTLGPGDADPVGRAAELAAERHRRARPRYLLRTPTGLAKGAPSAGNVEGTGGAQGGAAAGLVADAAAGPLADAATGEAGAAEGSAEGLGYRGLPWGTAVHGALDAAARGAAGVELRAVCRGLLLDADRPTAGGEPAELDELVALVERVTGSPLWRRARAGDRFLTEVPFAFHAPAGRLVDPQAPDAAAPRILEGVVDLAFREDGGWVIVDFKTDVGTDPGFPRRHAAYRRQVELYADVWEELTGEPVRERALFFTARPPDQAVEAW